MNKNQTVGQIVVNNPQLIETFSNLGIDFCCGGEMTLEEAANNLEITGEELIKKLQHVQKQENGEVENAISLDSPDLIQYIIDIHHKTELALLEEIDALLQKILRVHFKTHGKELSEIYEVFTQLKGGLIPHFYQEEKIDFIQFLDGKGMDIDELMKDHEGVGSLLDGLEEKTDGFTPPQDACTTYRLTFDKLKELAQDIHQHVFLENQVLFKRKVG